MTTQTFQTASRTLAILLMVVAASSRAQAPVTDPGPGRLTLAQANTIVTAAIERARELDYRPLTVVVLDDGGNLKAMQREDGASMFRYDVAVGKAYAAVGMGASSRYLAERARDNPNFFITLAATANGKFLPQPGGVLIRDADGNVLGAAGASGAAGTEDETAVAHGIRAAGLFTDLPD
jgi:uncharacterized protein GlcG (DUF336 family)